MTFDRAVREAARAADEAVKRAMQKYAMAHVTDEDDITGILLGRLDAALEGKIGGLSWTSSIVRHRRGVAAEERRIGADLVIHASVDTPTHKYSKGVLVQAKRINQSERLSLREKSNLDEQCRKMLAITPSAFVFDYSPRGMRCGSASGVLGTSERDLYNQCPWTPYRFFLEFFRCPIGDSSLTSASVDDLPVPIVFKIRAEGDLGERY